MEKLHNILQYEFFHVGGNDSRSLEEAMAECAERIAETLPLAMAGDDTGSGIKTVVRIYDADDRVTNLAIEMKKLEGARTTYCRFSRSNPFTFWYARWHIGRLDRSIASLKKPDGHVFY